MVLFPSTKVKTMWAASTLSYRLWPPTTTATGPFTVAAQYSRHRKNINYDYEDEEIDNDRELQILKQQQIDNDREFEIMKQQEIGDLDVNVSATKNSEKISGSVVLLALQKASAQKTSKKIKKKSKNIENVEDNKRNRRDAIVDYSDVKALCIKSDWKDRLDDLEKQLHQLIHNS